LGRSYYEGDKIRFKRASTKGKGGQVENHLVGRGDYSPFLGEVVSPEENQYRQSRSFRRQRGLQIK